MKTKKTMTRVLAFLLVVMMFFSTVEMTSFTSLAAEGEDATVSEEDLTEEISEENADEISEEASEEASEEISEEASEEASEEISEEVSEEASEEISEEVSEEASEEISEEVSEETSEEISEEVIVEFPEKALGEVLLGAENEYGSYSEPYIYLECEDMQTEDIPEYVERAISYWNIEEPSYENVSIRMPQMNGEEVISKELFNAVYKNVHTPKDTQVVFSFPELDGNSDIAWYFWKLKEAKSDFTAKIVIEETDKNGLLKVSFPVRSEIPSEEAFVEYRGEPDESVLYPKLENTFGILTGNDYMLSHNMRALDANLKLIDVNTISSYYVYEDYFAFDIQYTYSGKGWLWKEAYFAKPVNKGTIDDRNPIVLEHTEEGVSDAKFEVMKSDLWLLEIKNGKLSVKSTATGSFDNQGSVLCTYKNAEKKECVEVWNYRTVPGIDKINFQETEVEYVWDGSSDVFGKLNFYTNPTGRKGQIVKDEFKWEVENVTGTPIELVVKSDRYDFTDEFYEYYDGTYNVTGYGEAKVKVSYRGKEAVTTIKIVEPVKIPDIKTVYGVYGVDTTLADLDIHEWIQCGDLGTFVWEDVKTKLDVANKQEVYYDAIYQTEGRKPVSVRIPVQMVQIEELCIAAVEKTNSGNYKEVSFPDSILVNEQLVMGLSLAIYPKNEKTRQLIDKYISEGKLRVEWTDKEKLESVKEETPLYLSRVFIAGSKGKRTYKASLVNTKTKKTLKTAQKTLQIYEKEQFDFEKLDFGRYVSETNEMEGKICLTFNAEDYKKAGEKFTVKSLDTAVLKLGKMTVSEPDAEGIMQIIIPYTFKKYGSALVSITANDEAKTSKVYMIERIDHTPVLLTPQVTIDMAWVARENYLDFFYEEGVEKKKDITLKNEKDGSKFELSEKGVSGIIAIKDESIRPNKTYTVVLEISYEYEGKEYTVDKTLKIKVIHTKNKVKVKQLTTINEFYNYSEGDVLTTLQLTSSNGSVEDAWLSMNESMPFYLEEDDNLGEYVLRVKPGETIEKLTTKQKKIKLTVFYGGNDLLNIYEEVVEITLKTNKKEPKINAFHKTVILKPAIDIDTVYFFASNTDEGNEKLLENGLYVYDEGTKTEKRVRKHTGVYLEFIEEDMFTAGKNQYYITAEDTCAPIQLAFPEKAVASTDVIKYKIQLPHWKEAVTGKITIKVQTTPAQYKLKEKTIILNMNKELYRNDVAQTGIVLKDFDSNNTYLRGIEYFSFLPTDAKSKKVFNNNLVIEQTDYCDITARIVDLGSEKEGTKLKPGNYKVNINAMVDDTFQSFTLTIKVVDIAPSKVITYKQKGSIDLLNREESYVGLSYKLNFDLLDEGDTEEIKLVGPDAHMFDVEYDYKEIRIYAKQGLDYSTAKTYQVYPLVRWKLSDENKIVEYKGALQKIKVKQSKSSYKIVCLEPSTPVLCADREHEFGIGNLKNGEFVLPEKVELLNYTNELDFEYDSESGLAGLSYSPRENKQIKKSGGTYTLKFAVTPKGAATNSKPIIMTYKVKIIL